MLAALGNFSAYNARFHMPSQSSNGADSMWYGPFKHTTEALIDLSIQPP